MHASITASGLHSPHNGAILKRCLLLSLCRGVPAWRQSTGPVLARASICQIGLRHAKHTMSCILHAFPAQTGSRVNVTSLTPLRSPFPICPLSTSSPPPPRYTYKLDRTNAHLGITSGTSPPHKEWLALPAVSHTAAASCNLMTNMHPSELPLHDWIPAQARLQGEGDKEWLTLAPVPHATAASLIPHIHNWLPAQARLQGEGDKEWLALPAVPHGLGCDSATHRWLQNQSHVELFVRLPAARRPKAVSKQSVG